MKEGLVFDVGANNGDDTAHYLSRGFRVVAVEANPALCKQIAERFRGEKRLTIEPVGIAAQPGTETFWVNQRHSDFSAFEYEIASRGDAPEPVQVECVTPGELFKRHGVPYYLKVDIERRDILCLDALTPADLPAFVSAEAHALEYLAILWSKGYRWFRIVDQTAHNAGPLPLSNRTPVERTVRYAAHQLRRVRGKLASGGAFAPGSSGPVPDAYNTWSDLETVAYEWLHHQHGKHRGKLNPRGWFDFHARLSAPVVR